MPRRRVATRGCPQFCRPRSPTTYHLQDGCQGTQSEPEGPRTRWAASWPHPNCRGPEVGTPMAWGRQGACQAPRRAGRPPVPPCCVHSVLAPRPHAREDGLPLSPRTHVLTSSQSPHRHAQERLPSCEVPPAGSGCHVRSLSHLPKIAFLLVRHSEAAFLLSANGEPA